MWSGKKEFVQPLDEVAATLNALKDRFFYVYGAKN